MDPYQGNQGQIGPALRIISSNPIYVCQVEKEDLIIIPAGIFHRFTLDSSNTAHAMRLFQDQPKWTPLPRSHGGLESNPIRQQYVSSLTV